MINFKNFIINEDYPKEKDKIVDKIKKECSQYLKEISNVHHYYRGLFRGMSESAPSVGKIKSPTNRRPTSSTVEFHNTFDEIFKEEENVKNIRSRAVFCSTSEENASFYSKISEPHFIFPVNNYSYWYKPHIRDSWMNFITWTKSHYKIERENIWQYEEKDFYPLIKEFFFKRNEPYTNKNIADMINNRVDIEVMLLCDYYYAIANNTENQDLLVDIRKK